MSRASRGAERKTQEGTSLSRELRINEMIRVPQVRVVDDEGSQLGVMATGEALRLAQERGLDLVEVAPMASPPVVRLLDYGQFKYEQTRREKEARRHQRSVEFKEIRLRPKIGQGDFDTKVRRAIQFLEAGGRIKVAVQFRGRELTHAYIGRDLLTRFADLIKDHGAVERQPILEGKSMSIVVASTHKPGHATAAADQAEAPARTPRTDGPPRGTDSPPAPPAPAEPTPTAAPETATPAPSQPARAATPRAQPRPQPAARQAAAGE
jgi:translation initiation factor IF-3